MNKHKSTYFLSHKVSAVFMILTLLWLTVSTPFVCSFKQEMAKQVKIEKAESGMSHTQDNSNPLGNNTEEKTTSSPTSVSEEYLHHHETTHFILSQSAKLYQCSNTDTYTAFHGELLVPPPNAA